MLRWLRLRPTQRSEVLEAILRLLSGEPNAPVGGQPWAVLERPGCVGRYVPADGGEEGGAPYAAAVGPQTHDPPDPPNRSRPIGAAEIGPNLPPAHAFAHSAMPGSRPPPSPPPTTGERRAKLLAAVDGGFEQWLRLHICEVGGASNHNWA